MQYPRYFHFTNNKFKAILTILSGRVRMFVDLTHVHEPWNHDVMTFLCREEPDISLLIMNSKARLHPTRYVRIISLKRSSTLNTRTNDLICTHIERVTLRKRKNCFVNRCEG